MIRLDLNESPLPPPEEVLNAAREALGEANRYPSLSLVRRLEEALADYVGVKPEMVAVTCGGDVALLSLFLASRVGGGGVAVYPRFSFSVYREAASAAGARSVRVPMREEGDTWVIDEEELFSAARRADIVLLDSPNNPTGSILLEPRRLEELAEEARGLVVVDEAYYEFSGVTVAGAVESHSNLVVVRTLSKAFSMAGLRVGYVVAPPEVASLLRRTTPFPTSTPSIAAALAAVRLRAYAEKLARMIVEEREWLRSEASRLARKVYRSHANFILVDTGVEGAADALRRLGVAVRATEISGRHVRVTVAGRRESLGFLRALEKVRPGGGSSQPP